nr:MAG TPA: hypothetical protein [Caudoviricetes sp.]
MCCHSYRPRWINRIRKLVKYSANNRREPSPNAGGEERRKSPQGFKNIITVLA